ncbi:hypothetical protein ACS0TY_033304 [Phlomoides rotata]
MSIKKGNISTNLYEDGDELRRGPWTFEEDNLLIQYITSHGEGQWNSLAKFAGLKRTGKSCRLRWLNYLKPDIKRGNLTPHEQLLILELHSRWGNRWSKIAQHLPGRTDNEIKNYWRTRVQKQARHLKLDSNSNKFLEAFRTHWMPRLLEKIAQESSSSSSSITIEPQNLTTTSSVINQLPISNSDNNSKFPEVSGINFTQESCGKSIEDDRCYHVDIPNYDMQELGSRDVFMPELHVTDSDWFGQEFGCSFWNIDELWEFRKVGV